MSRCSRRKFLATAVTSALLAACATTPVGKQNSSTLTKTPTRIVALEWVYVEDLLALGIQPVGVADISGYKQYVDIEPKLADSVVDVGTRQEPSLEAIAKLNPDLILGVESRHDAIYNSLSSIAPTLLFNPYPDANGATQLEKMQQIFLAIADTVDRRNAGEAVLQNMRESFKTGAEQLRSAELKQNSFVLGQMLPGDPQLRLFTENSLAVQIISQIGLENAWEGKFDAVGFNTVGLEALPTIEQANFLYIAKEDYANWQQLQNQPVWKQLAFVQEKRLYPIGEDTWVFGGPLSAEALVENVVTSLTKK